MGYASDILAQIGETITVTIKTQTDDDWGKETETQVATGTTTASFQITDGSEEAVKQGLMETGDAQVFFKPDDTYYTYFNMANYNIYLTYNSIDYKVYRIIKEPASIESGHWELHARRV